MIVELEKGDLILLTYRTASSAWMEKLGRQRNNPCPNVTSRECISGDAMFADELH